MQPGKKLEKALNRCNHQMLVYKRECDSCTELESVSTFLMMVNQLLEELAGWLEAHKTSEIRKQVLEFYFNLRNFSEIYNLVDENYLIYTSYLDNGDFALRLFCVNPAGESAAVYQPGAVGRLLFRDAAAGAVL